MKKFLCGLVLAFCLMGCSCEGQYKSQDIPSYVNMTAVHFTSEGHDYIVFRYSGHFVGVEHDPDCWCMVDYD